MNEFQLFKEGSAPYIWLVLV